MIPTMTSATEVGKTEILKRDSNIGVAKIANVTMTSESVI